MCLESIAQQSYPDFEVIVIDDGSTDGSGAVAEEFARKDNRFFVIHQSNNGMALARNAGLDVARGKYVAFVDSDDWIHPQMLELMLSSLIKTGSDISMADFIKTSDSNHSLAEYEDFPLPHVFDGYSAVKSLIENIKPGYSVVWNKLYDRKLIGHTRFMKTVSEDFSFNMALFMKASTVSHLTVPLVYYRQRKDSVTHSADYAYYIDRVASAFQGYDVILRHNSPQLEKQFLWRWLKYALNRLNMVRNTEYEPYASDVVSTIMTEYWSDAVALLPWHKQILLKSMWKNKNLNSFILSIHKWLKSLQ